MSQAPSVSIDNGKASRIFRRVLLGMALLLLIGHFFVYVGYAISLAQFPFDYDQGEGFELNDTVLLSQGQSPYRDNAVYPFYASNYPPLYHVFLVPFVWLFGPQYWYGRLFGFAASLITAAAIAFAVQRATGQRVIAIIAGLCYVASNYIYHIGPLFRQHITMVMFETLAIVALSIAVPIDSDNTNQSPRIINRRVLFLGLLCLLLAGFTKQLAIVTAGAFFAYLFLQIPRRAIGYGVLLAAIAGGLFVLINFVTGGQWWLNIIAANVNGYIASQFIGLARQFFGLHGALFILACLYGLYELYFARLSVYTVWFAFAAAGSALSGKWGAGDSYFSTLIAAMCILAGLFLARAWTNSWIFADNYLSRGFKKLGIQRFIGLVAPVTAGMFTLYGLAVIHMPLDGPIFETIATVFNIQSNTKFANFYDAAGWTQGYATIGQRPTDNDVANGWEIVDALKADPRPALSEEAAFEFRASKPVISNPTQLLNVYNNGLSDPAALVKMIADQAFGVVVFRARFYPQPVLDAVDSHYRLDVTIPMNGYEYQILVPR